MRWPMGVTDVQDLGDVVFLGATAGRQGRAIIRSALQKRYAAEAPLVGERLKG